MTTKQRMRPGEANQTQRLPRRLPIPYLILTTALLLTGLACYYVSRTAEAKDQAHFRASAQEITAAILGRLQTYVALLRAGTGLYAASGSVEPREFRNFVAQLELNEHYPGIRGFGFAARVKREEKDALVARMRGFGVKDFHLWPEQNQSEYLAIAYLEPLDQRNQAGLGYDMSTEPTRRAAMERARDTGLPATSGRVKLVQEIDPSRVQSGFLIYAPAYRNNGPDPTTAGERRAALTGFIYGAFRADDFLKAVFANKTPDVDFQVFDGRELTPENLLHDSTSAASQPRSGSPRFRASTTLDVAGRPWSIAFATRPEFDSASSKGLVLYTALGGLLLSLLLFGVARSQATAREAAEKSAAELRQSEEALRESESRLRRLVDANVVGLTIKTLAGKIIEANDAFLKIVGYTRDELEGGSLTLFEITAPEYRALDQRALEEMKATGTHQPFEKEYIRKDGSRVPVLVGSTYLGGPEEMAVGFLLDLSESKRAEKERRESEERYRSLFESNPLPMYVYDVQTLSFLAVNEATIHHYGYSRAEFLSRSLLDIRPPEEIPALLNAVSKRLPGIDNAGEFKHQKKDGSVIAVEITSHPLAFDGHEAELVLANDVTEHKHAARALREADQRAIVEYEKLLEKISSLSQALGTARDLRTIFRALRDFAMVSVPFDGLLVSLCDPVRAVRNACYGWCDGQEVDISALPPMPITTEGPNSRAVRTGQIIITNDYLNAKRGHPTVIAGPDNGLRPQSSLAAPMAVMGRIIGTIETQSYQPAAYQEGHATAIRMAANLTAVAIENVRLLERESSARASAEESNRLKDEFLATVSHELRTPLTAILGWSRMLETGGLDPAVAARAIETIGRNARAQSQIIDDILDVARIITGNLYLDLQPIELAPVIEASINVVRSTAEAKDIQIDTDLDSQPTVVFGDSNRLQQVFWNLLSNAIKFTPTGGWVRVAVHQRESCVEIKVADNGQGIGADFLPFVFDRFRQADSTTTRQHGGLGLGLAIARQLVEIHGGSVLAESAGEQKGATFTVQLPGVVSGTPRGRDHAAKRESEKMVPELIPALAGVRVRTLDNDLAGQNETNDGNGRGK